MMLRIITMVMFIAVMPSCMLLDSLSNVAPSLSSSFGEKSTSSQKVEEASSTEESIPQNVYAEASQANQTVSIPMPKGPALQPSASGLDVQTIDAARFLTQATFGPTESSIQRVKKMGFEAWIHEQTQQSVTHHLNYVDRSVGKDIREVYRPVRIEAWLDATVWGKRPIKTTFRVCL